MTECEIISDARRLCQKFVDKVENGRARSVETYAECVELLRKIEEYAKDNQIDD